MKAVNIIVKILKIPFKFFYKIGSSPIKFVYNKQKKLIKIISPSNVKIVAVKISRAGKKIIVTIVFIVSIISSSGVESQKMSESSCTLPAKMSIERVIEVPHGGAVNHPWSPGHLKLLVVKLQIYVVVDFCRYQVQIHIHVPIPVNKYRILAIFAE